MIPQEERSITYYTVTLGDLTREGDALAEIITEDEVGTIQQHMLRVPLVSLVSGLR